MSRRWAWQCRRRGCDGELAIVEDGQLYPHPLLPVRVDQHGTVWVRCTAMLDGGRLCNAERGWTVRGRGERSEEPVLESDRLAL